MRDPKHAAETVPSRDRAPTLPDPGAVATVSSQGVVDGDRVAERVAKLGIQSNAASRYETVGEVGRGGMGAVLEAFDTDLRRRLAMKVILERVAEPESGGSEGVCPATLARFLEEAQITGQLDHPGVVPVHELGVDAEGRVYFTMPLVQGRELASVIEEVHCGSTSWTMTRALGVVLSVCEAMSYAHDKGVIHRDLKPANVMVGDYGEVYVMDWGLARVVGEGPSDESLRVQSDRSDAASETPSSVLATLEGTVMGTPCFMAPEQAMGSLADVGPAADIYATGAILYHLLTGQMPYAAPGSTTTAQDVLRLVGQGPPDPVQRLAPAASPELVAICERAMARDPDARYASMRALAEDVRAFLENRVVRAHRTGAVAELKKWMQRNRALAMTLAFSTMLVVGGSLWASAVFRTERDRARDAESEARHHAGVAQEAQSEAERERDIAQRRLVRSHSRVGERLLLDADPRGAALWFVEALAAADSMPELADLQRRRLASILGRSPELIQIADTGEHNRRSQLSADGSRLLTWDFEGSALWDTASGRQLATMRGWMGTLSPNGDYLALIRHFDPDHAANYPRTELQLASGRTGEILGRADAVRGEALVRGFVGDGPTFLIDMDHWDDRPRELRIWNGLQGGEPETRMPYRDAGSFRLVADGTVAAGRGSTEAGTDAVVVCRLGDPRSVREIALPAPATELALAADGGSVAASWDHRAQVWNVPSGRPMSPVLDHGAPIDFLKYSADAGLVVTASVAASEGERANPDYVLKIWRLGSSERATVVELGHRGVVEVLELAGDGGRLVSITQQWEDGRERPYHLACAIDTASGEVVAVGRKDFAQTGRLRMCRVLSNGRWLTTLDTTREHDGTREEVAAISWDPSAPDFDPIVLEFGGLAGAASFDAQGIRVALSPPGQRYGSSRMQGAFVLDLAGRKAWMPPPSARGAMAMARRGDGRAIVTVGGDGFLRLLSPRSDSDSGVVADSVIQRAGHALRAVALSGDGTAALVGTDRGEAQWIEWATGSALGPSVRFDEPVVEVGVLDDGSGWARSASNGVLMVGKPGPSRGAGGEPFQSELDPPDASSQLVDSAVAVDVDRATGNVLVLHSVGWLVTSRTGERVHPLERSTLPCTAGAFEARGRRFAVAVGDDEDGEIQVFDTETGDVVGRTRLHGARVRSLRFHPNGVQLASASDDRTAVLWDVETGAAVARPMQHDAPVTALCYSDDGAYLATVEQGGVVRIWSSHTGELVTAPIALAEGVQGGIEAVDLFFLAGDTALAVLPADGALRVIELAPDSRPLAELRHRVETMSRRRVGTTGHVFEIPPEELASQIRERAQSAAESRSNRAVGHRASGEAERGR